MLQSTSPTTRTQLDSLSLPVLARRLEGDREQAVALRCWVDLQQTALERGGQSLSLRLSLRSDRKRLLLLEGAIRSLEHEWIQRLLHLERAALAIFAQMERTPGGEESQESVEFQDRSPPAAACAESSSIALPAEIWAQILEFSLFNPQTVASLFLVDRATRSSVLQACYAWTRSALDHALAAPFVGQLGPFCGFPGMQDLDELGAVFMGMTDKLFDRAFLLSAEGLSWSRQARQVRSSSFLRELGREIAFRTAKIVQEQERRGPIERARFPLDLESSWWEDPEFALELARLHTRELQRVSKSLLEDRAFVLKVCRVWHWALYLLPPIWRSDRAVVMEAIRHPGANLSEHPLMWTDPVLRDDESVLKEAIAVRANAYRWGSPRLQKNRDLIRLALEKDYTLYRSLAGDLWRDVDIALLALRCDRRVFPFLPKPLKEHSRVQELVQAQDSAGEASGPALLDSR